MIAWSAVAAVALVAVIVIVIEINTLRNTVPVG